MGRAGQSGEEEEVGCRARPSGGINIPSHIRFCSDLVPFADGRRAQRLLIDIWGLKSVIFALK